jgi:hypothetical protein
MRISKAIQSPRFWLAFVSYVPRIFVKSIVAGTVQYGFRLLYNLIISQLILLPNFLKGDIFGKDRHPSVDFSIRYRGQDPSSSKMRGIHVSTSIQAVLTSNYGILSSPFRIPRSCHSADPPFWRCPCLLMFMTSSSPLEPGNSIFNLVTPTILGIHNAVVLEGPNR